jgi:GntR family transcriptional regulator
MREMIEFHLDVRSGVPTYLQLVQQVRQAVRLGILVPGDQLPTVKEVVGRLAINPNTVLKAYRELDHEHLVEGRRGQGTFVCSESPSLPPDEVKGLRSQLERWVAQARAAGLDDDNMAALFSDTVRQRSSKAAA